MCAGQYKIGIQKAGLLWAIMKKYSGLPEIFLMKHKTLMPDIRYMRPAWYNVHSGLEADITTPCSSLPHPFSGTPPSEGM